MKKKLKIKKANNQYLRPKLSSALLANLIVFAIYGYCYWLIMNNNNLYLSIVIEDGFIEWSTVWVFLLASAVSIYGAIKAYNQLKKFQWFYVGLSLFCFLVAMEEISWGQRLFGYRAPNYFLENNFQQEFTIHNTVRASFRTIMVEVVVLGYGVLLPLLNLIPSISRLLHLTRIIVPPIELIPSFLAVAYIFHIDPWVATGEVIELMMGFSFLFAVLFRVWEYMPFVKNSSNILQFTTILMAAFLTLGLGLGTANWSTYRTKNNPILQNVCYKELEAIKSDFIWKTNQQGYSPLKKYFQMRLYRAVKTYDFDWMYKGKYAALTEQGLSQDRADFFLDPWNMPYWVMFKLNKVNGRKRLVIYSFGPNRKLDSDNWVIRGDDIGLVLLDTDLK